MTIEEKAPYLDKADKYWHQNANLIGLYSKENELDVKNAYIDGLAEGRKDILSKLENGIIKVTDSQDSLRKKTWMEENYPIRDFPYDSYNSENVACKIAIEKVCKKILEEVDDTFTWEGQLHQCFSWYELKEIIEDLGVEV